MFVSREVNDFPHREVNGRSREFANAEVTNFIIGDKVMRSCTKEDFLLFRIPVWKKRSVHAARYVFLLFPTLKSRPLRRVMKQSLIITLHCHCK